MSSAADSREMPWGPLQRGAILVGAAGLVMWAFGWAIAALRDDPDLHRKVFFSYLFAFAFCLAIPLGGMAIRLIHSQTGGAWGRRIQRVLDAAMRTVPFMAILFVPLLFGLGRLYLWADLSQLHDEALRSLLERKAPFLNVPWFILRACCYFAVWGAVAVLLSRGFAAAEARSSPMLARRMQIFVGPAFLGYGLGMTFAAIDWLMSLEPDWFSTIYGMLVASGQLVPALGFAVAATAWLTPYLPEADRHDEPQIWNDLGNLMLASVMFWAYLSLSQWLLIWSGNLTEEIPWYLRRSQGGWQAVAWLLGVGYFALPFLVLLSRRIKRDRRGVMAVGAALVLVSVVHYFWLVNPVYTARVGGGYEHHGHFSVHWLDFAALAGLGGTVFAIFLWQLRSRPLTPPQLLDAAEEGMHA